jgi:hypothetical protein
MPICIDCKVDKSEDSYYRRKRVVTVKANGRVCTTYKPEGYRYSRCKSCEMLRVNAVPRYLRHKFGLTPEGYMQLLAAQGEKCKICGKSEHRRLSVDHDHVTGKLRGLLCNACNRGIGMFKDDPELLLKAIDYLKGRL